MKQVLKEMDKKSPEAPGNQIGKSTSTQPKQPKRQAPLAPTAQLNSEPVSLEAPFKQEPVSLEAPLKQEPVSLEAPLKQEQLPQSNQPKSLLSEPISIPSVPPPQPIESKPALSKPTVFPSVPPPPPLEPVLEIMQKEKIVPDSVKPPIKLVRPTSKMLSSKKLKPVSEKNQREPKTNSTIKVESFDNLNQTEPVSLEAPLKQEPITLLPKRASFSQERTSIWVKPTPQSNQRLSEPMFIPSVPPPQPIESKPALSKFFSRPSVPPPLPLELILGVEQKEKIMPESVKPPKMLSPKKLKPVSEKNQPEQKTNSTIEA